MSTVLEFPKVARRKAIAEMSKDYIVAIIQAVSRAKVTHRDHLDEDGQPLALRDMDRTESRNSAVITAAVFFQALIYIRAKMEGPPKEMADTDYGLYTFLYEADKRRKHYERDRFASLIVMSEPGVRELLEMRERDYAHHVFTALKIEAKNDPEFNEPQFWADIFRGFADADTSGVVLRAAGLVLLDYMDDFSRALDFHK